MGPPVGCLYEVLVSSRSEYSAGHVVKAQSGQVPTQLQYFVLQDALISPV